MQGNLPPLHVLCETLEGLTDSELLKVYKDFSEVLRLMAEAKRRYYEGQGHSGDDTPIQRSIANFKADAQVKRGHPKQNMQVSAIHFQQCKLHEALTESHAAPP